MSRCGRSERHRGGSGQYAVFLWSGGYQGDTSSVARSDLQDVVQEHVSHNENSLKRGVM